MGKNNLSPVGQGAVTKTVANLVKSLSVRNKDIISRRFGLKNGKKETLESIGKSYGITRERVRQIEESTLGQLMKSISSSGSDLNKYSNLAADIIGRSGGIIKEKDMFKEFSGSSDENVVNASLAFILRLNRELVRAPENDNFYAFWALNKNHADSFVSSVASLTGLLEKNKKALSEDNFYNFILESGISGIGGQSFSRRHVDLGLAISKNLGKNIFDEI